MQVPQAWLVYRFQLADRLVLLALHRPSCCRLMKPVWRWPVPVLLADRLARQMDT